jgi:hypothetical protein
VRTAPIGSRKASRGSRTRRKVRATPISILYADLSRWGGTAGDYRSSPDVGVLVVKVHHPEPRHAVEAVGWDHYGLRVTDSFLMLGLWKEPDATDADGSPDPYRGKSLLWTFYPDGKQERGDYTASRDLPAFPVVRHGLWVDDATARRAGIL